MGAVKSYLQYPAPFSRATSLSLIVCLYSSLLKTIKINGVVIMQMCVKSSRFCTNIILLPSGVINDEYLVNNWWMVTLITIWATVGLITREPTTTLTWCWCLHPYTIMLWLTFKYLNRSWSSGVVLNWHSLKFNTAINIHMQHQIH